MNGTAEKIRMACDHIMKSGEGRPGVLYIRDNAERMLQAGWRFRLPYDDPENWMRTGATASMLMRRTEADLMSGCRAPAAGDFPRWRKRFIIWGSGDGSEHDTG